MILALIHISIYFSAYAAPVFPHDSKVAEDGNLVEYLHTYGYLSDYSNGSNISQVGLAANTLLSIETIREAIRRLQVYANLNVTGVLDRPTLRLMQSQRCGLQDVDLWGRNKRTTRSTYGRKWRNIKHILWQLDMERLPDFFRLYWLSAQYVLYDIRKAFNTWSIATGALFVQTDDEASSDIRIMFARSDHGCGYNFDGIGGTLGHAFYPDGGLTDISGDIHFDLDEKWIAGGNQPDYDGKSTSLFHVALHEIGHSMGLTHNSNPMSVMFPWYSTHLVDANTPHLPIEDVAAFHELYSDQYDDGKGGVSIDTGKKALTEQCGCKNWYGPYDDITYIGNEIFVVKYGKIRRFYDGRVTDTREQFLSDYFSNLPKNKTVQAFHYDSENKLVLIAIRDDLFVYKLYETSHAVPYQRFSLRFDIGVLIGNSVDTIFISHNGDTYIFTGQHYWKLNIFLMKAQYMGYIKTRWSGMLNGGYDAVFHHNEKLYFVKNNWYWEVNETMNKPLAYKQVIGNILPRCRDSEGTEELKLENTIINTTSNNVSSLKMVFKSILFSLTVFSRLLA
jgi:hypothetical protein